MNAVAFYRNSLEAAAGLTIRAGLPEPDTLTPVAGGANNRLYRVETGGEPIAAMKAYFRHPEDPTDRLASEFAFTTFAWEHGVTAVPRPLGADAEAGIALYEWVSGIPLTPGRIDEDAVAQALALYRDLNRHLDTEAARALPEARESCFSVAEHLETVARRVEALAGMEAADDLDYEAKAFVSGSLVPAWNRLRDKTAECSDTASPRRLSPSDFGFHNALREVDGRLRFLDFEYAGWDDPAKLVGDFFNQVAVPVPTAHFPAFAKAVAADLPDPAAETERFRALLPVYTVKWVCITLNEFLPANRERRRFAAGGQAGGDPRPAQLEKARALLGRLGREPE